VSERTLLKAGRPSGGRPDPQRGLRGAAEVAQLAESQLGTVGLGNHYVNVLEDEDGRI
jgi:hypothetical protein